MAIKISGSTIIDDSRVLINTGNVGVGTTNPTSAVDSGNTSVVHAGIVTANYLYGDGSNLTNLDAGFEPDADGNLFAGTSAGGTYDPATGTANNNIALGTSSGVSLISGDINIFLGSCAGNSLQNGTGNFFAGANAGRNVVGGLHNIYLGCNSADVYVELSFGWRRV